ncbi:MAG: hypothetical protein COV72_00105 [Candidatus Omnitrophica bacterium CG11_big_fil_rev_8_21_14_0_20_42_13]|uniref:DUF1844 domain-containing protein n=1 Tax=Candidatus Ghiorseimicrobium undicola TaxID=1974746 RepID=A0A2H0LZT9_9BACT|nr:MAG: hypothetical protein COV72_00105 [Candidatus Omnitrophica bacterium CG11_big_fil_rev_8_21_14_0_20_42_13]
MTDENKNIDEVWKEAAEKEKSASREKDGAEFMPEPDFSFFLSTLAIQAAIFLGDIPNPSTNEPEENLPQAKFIIDTLGVLKEKTVGNLSTEEDSLIDKMLYDLRMKYMAKTKTA